MKTDNPNDIKLKGRKKKIVYALDWAAQDYKDRLDCVNELYNRGSLDDLSPTQLNEVTNYLLYSSDVECAVELKQPSKKPISYEELVENGVADMAFYNARHKKIYKSPKPTIDREKDENIPGMKELWEEMAKVKEIYDYLDDCLKGRREKDFTNPMEINYVNHHFYKKWYIDLCLNQYTLKDCYNPVMQMTNPTSIELPFDNYNNFGIHAGEFIYNENDKDRIIDLGNPIHVYMLLKNYRTIRLAHRGDILDDWNILYDMLDDAIARCNFNDCIWDILEMKINGKQNNEVGEYVRDKYGVNYNDNYISTLFTKSISKKIAKGAITQAKRTFNKTEKHICPKCKEERWNDEFYSFAKACGYCLHKIKPEERKIKVRG